MEIATAVILVAALSTGWCSRSTQQKESVDEKEVINILTLLPYYDQSNNPSWNHGNDVQPALDLAMDQINNNSQMLENYTLNLIHGNSGCDILTQTAVVFVEKVFSQHRPVGIVGPGCSSSTILLGPITQRSEVGLVMVHGGGSPTLQNRTEYKYLLGTLGSTINFVHGYLSLMKKGNWNKLGILYDNSRLYYLNTKRLLLQEISDRNMSVQYTSAVTQTYIPLNIIRKELLRVIFIMCPLELTQHIICLANHSQMAYKDYQFVIMSHRFHELTEVVNFTYDGERYICSKDDMARTLEKLFLITYNVQPRYDDTLLVSNTTYHQYLKYYQIYRESGKYDHLTNNGSRNISYSYWATYFYDAVWAWALVLDNLTKKDPSFQVNTATYGNLTRSDLILEQFYETSFPGVSGEISFSRTTGFVPRETRIYQINNGSSDHVASISSNGSLYQVNESIPIVQINASFPNETLRENHILGAFFCTTIAVQFFIVLILHVITVTHSEAASIKATSPKLHHATYIGIYIIIVGTFILALYPAASIDVHLRHIFCQLFWTWFLPIGFTLAFSPVAMRTFRIYRIFEHYLDPGPFISTPVLFIGIGVFLLLDLVIAITWTCVDPFKLREFNHTTKGERDEISKVQVRQDCHCMHLSIWIAVLFAYKSALLLIVATFAVLTQKIDNHSFTTKSLRVLVYLLTFVLLLGLTINTLLQFTSIGDHDYNRDYRFSTISLTMNIMVILFIVCIFLPPVIPILSSWYTKLRRKKNIFISLT